MKFLLLLACFTQTPAITLTVPEAPVAYARFVRMSVTPPAKGEAPNDWESYSVNWDVTERATTSDPLENDLEIDSNRLKGFVPAGLNPTSLKVRVSVIFVYKDYSTRVAEQTKFVTIGSGTDVIVPPPGPNNPVPGPVNPQPINPDTVVIPATEKFGLQTWSYSQARLSPLTKSEARLVGEGFRKVAGLARNGAMSNREQVVSSMTEYLQNIDKLSLQAWIDSFLEPLRRKLNPIAPKIKTVADQADLFDEIGFGLLKYSQEP